MGQQLLSLSTSLAFHLSAEGLISGTKEIGRSTVIATYVALILMFCVHLAMIILCGISPIVYIKKAWTVLTFAFTSRTSAGIIPMNINCQTKKLGVPDSIASMSAGIGATIAALIVLPIIGLPIELVGFLITIEPILDQGRTALNVSGAMTVGVVTSKLLGNFIFLRYNNIKKIISTEFAIGEQGYFVLW